LSSGQNPAWQILKQTKSKVQQSMEPFAIKLDMVQSIALAVIMLFIGYGIKKKIPILDKYSIPAAVVGGLLFSFVALALKLSNVVLFTFDTTLQMPMMIAFFTTIGLGANFRLLKVGGVQVITFLVLSSFLAVLQNVVGVLLSVPLGVHPFVGLLTGSISLVGGLGTGAAFGGLMESPEYGFVGAVPVAVAAATFGLISGGLMGGPIATALIKRHKPKHETLSSAEAQKSPDDLVASFDKDIPEESHGESVSAYRLLKIIAVILVAMGVGSLFSKWLGTYITLPAYIGAMIIAGVICNIAPSLKIKIEQVVVDDLGVIFLSLFLTMALVSLDITKIFALALPMLVLLMAQVVLMGVFAYWFTYRFMGRDYDAAVMSSGLVGFSLGSTANAVSNMETVCAKYGPAPRAFLVVPIVGAFFVDFANALIITGFMNWVK